jgi:uncharacterized protein (UPF0254 family)
MNQETVDVRNQSKVWKVFALFVSTVSGIAGVLKLIYER